MLAWSTTALHAVLLCLPFSIFVVVTFGCWPRLWLHSMPPDIRARAAPKSRAERQGTLLLGVVAVLLLPGLSVASTLWAARVAPEPPSFLGVAVHLYGLWATVHLWDFAVIDCGYAWLMDPAKPPIAGTEGAAGYRDLRFHWRACQKALLMSWLFVLPAAWLLSRVR